VTLRLVDGLPSLRSNKPFASIRAAFLAARERFGFRLNHFSVMHNHLHLIVEAESNASLEKGMTGLKVRVARALNKLFGRSGALFAERYHVHVLEKPLEVRNALKYVLLNHLRHGISSARLDIFSSARAFDGWSISSPRTLEPIAPARTWLLRIGWKEKAGGPLRPEERPARR
jgi:REP element-mobilizing transposase RayT